MCTHFEGIFVAAAVCCCSPSSPSLSSPSSSNVCAFFFLFLRNTTFDVGKYRKIITTPVNISQAMRSYLCICIFYWYTLNSLTIATEETNNSRESKKQQLKTSARVRPHRKFNANVCIYEIKQSSWGWHIGATIKTRSNPIDFIFRTKFFFFSRNSRQIITMEILMLKIMSGCKTSNNVFFF